jgi:hypothetical protein
MKSISACSKVMKKLRSDKEMRDTLNKRASRFKRNQGSPLEMSLSNGNAPDVEDRLILSKTWWFRSNFALKLSKSL